MLDSFEKGQNVWATQGLVDKADAIGLVSHGVCEKGNLCGRMGMGVGNNRGRRR